MLHPSLGGSGRRKKNPDVQVMDLATRITATRATSATSATSTTRAASTTFCTTLLLHYYYIVIRFATFQWCSLLKTHVLLVSTTLY